MIKIAVPNKGSLSESAVEILTEAGYKGRGHSKTLNVVDADNGVEFFFLRPKDIAIYVARGVLDLGITGRDLALDSKASFDEVLPLGFGGSTFRYAAPQGEEWDISQLDGRRIATSYPNLVRANLAEHGIEADVIRLDGAVEISIRLGVADVIAETTALAEKAAGLGCPEDLTFIDPTHDFGKNTYHGLELLRRIDEIVDTGWPVLMALSNKDFVGETLARGVGDRVAGTLAATAWAAAHGVAAFRVHEVAETIDVIRMTAAIQGTAAPLDTTRGLA